MSHAIPTLYEGIEYRSRLEARWAAFFDRIGWKFTYEPFDTAGYIPDFLIHGPAPLLVEIKPAVTAADYWAPIEKIENGLHEHWTHDVLILGADPLPTSLYALYFGEGRPPAGVLGEWTETTHLPTLDGVRLTWRVSKQLLGTELYEQLEWDEYPEPYWHFGTGHWFRCGKDGCSQICVTHSDRTWSGRPCGHHDDQEYLDYAPYMKPLDLYEIKDAWREACNEVKWRRGAAYQPSYRDRYQPSYGQQNAPIPDIPPAGITPQEWRDMPLPAKQAIANVAAGLVL